MNVSDGLPLRPLGWVFDLDGTLTVGKHDFDAIRVELELPPGRPILEEIEMQPATRRSGLRQRLAEIEWDIAGKTEPASGAHLLLESLRRSGIAVAILTRNDRDIALHTLEAAKLRHFFADDVVIGRDCVEPKPSPAGIAHIAQKWGFDPRRTAMVGDYVFDLMAGRAAGAYTIHVAAEPRAEWSNYVDLYVRDLPTLQQRAEHEALFGD